MKAHHLQKTDGGPVYFGRKQGNINLHIAVIFYLLIDKERYTMGILRTIILVVLALWLIGFLFKVAGGLIHILLLIAGVLFIIDLVSGRRGKV